MYGNQARFIVFVLHSDTFELQQLPFGLGVLQLRSSDQIEEFSHSVFQSFHTDQQYGEWIIAISSKAHIY